MKISAKIEYACRALLELGMHWPDQSPLQVGEIARKQKIPMKFLIHIMIHLKQLGYVESIRGKKGGYVLVAPPLKVKLSDIIKSFGGLGYSSVDDKKRPVQHVMDAVWQEIDRFLYDFIDKINLEYICEREKSNGKTITYEI